MKSNVGFVGFDGTESKRALLAIHQVKEAEGIEGDMNVLLRSPHGGQAPSDYPEFAQFLVREGIDSISINPDSVMKITLKVLETEKSLGM